MLKTLSEVLQQRRQEPSVAFNFAAVEAICKRHDIVVQIPRRTGRQTQRANYSAEAAATPSDYYRLAVFIPYTDHLISEMTSRFSGLKKHVITIQMLIPRYVISATYQEVQQAVVFYAADIQQDSIILGEFDRWKLKWSKVSSNERPANAVDALSACSEMFPNIQKLLKIFATLPVSTATAERSFSTLRRLKTYLRTTMTNDRLNGLALMSIHRDIVTKLNPQDVISQLAKKNRRLDFVI